ncbi:cell division protein FtsQ/DivIB [Agrobacterium sp. Azo12]|jgi:cell division protein FtsQ|uniref:cell division protein FtsQ/DivIB n=1 Tax=Agrobacterium sp. Azo12 TaxID=3031129 RepID=UPI0023D8247D|nr:cell division protein FtsQ/DivIB [Agrobacterium sp. Azo12]MDO5896267.1 cell division protein FtsQ/DivIB [Agrobacterium sp. Azo12]
MIGGKKANRRRVEQFAPAADERIVLPRPLRRVVRFCVSLATGRVNIPAHTGTISAVAFFAATGLYGMSLGGHTQTVAQATTSAAGFAIEDVKVSGNAQTSEIDILQLLGLDGTTSLVAMDVNTARRRLADLPWVEDVDVRKIYPRTIEIRLKERDAFGIWQHGSELSLIEKNGSVIAPLRDNKFAALPLFVGRDAETGAASFMEQLDAWPEIRSKVKAYVRISGRRWDLHLNNGIIIKLPEVNVAKALHLLSRLDAEQQVMSRDIAAIDLRLSDRTTIQLTQAATERREAAVTAREKALKKAGNI